MKPFVTINSTRASCDTCRKAKVRCEKNGESCTRCLHRGERCIFSPVTRKQTGKLPASHRKSIDEMKIRLERVESLLSTSVLEGVDKHPGNPCVPATGEDGLSLLLTDQCGFSSFIGSASGFSLFSPRGLNWISNRVGSTELAKYVLERAQAYMLSWSEELTSSWQSLSPEIRTPLPSKPSADVAVDYFFEFFNSTMPLYNKDMFMELYEFQYSTNPPITPSWYASLNVVLAIGSLMHDDETSMSNVNPKKAIDVGGYLGYLRNCYSVFTQLVFSCREIMAVQALVGMAFILETLLDAEAGYMAIGAATRLSISLGLHRRFGDSCLSAREIEERQNVFWVLYIFEKMASLRLGRPSFICDSDIEIHEPGVCNSTAGEYTSDGALYFESFVKLAKIESEIHNKLYSAPCTSPNSWAQRVATVDHLSRKVTDWRDTLPGGIIKPGQPVHCIARLFPTAVLLHSEYYNCLSMLHRLPSHYATTTVNDGLLQSSSAGGFEAAFSQTACLDAARSTVKILESLKERCGRTHHNLVRRISYYPLSAFLTIFANLLLYPHATSALGDLNLLRFIVDLLSNALSTSRSPLAMMLLEVFQKMTDMAKSFLHRIHSAETDLECTKTMPVESSTMDAVCDTPQFLRIQRKDHPGQAQNITIASHFDPISTPMLEEFSQTGSLSLDSNPDPSENLAGFPQSGLGGGRSNYSPFWSSADQTGSHDLVSKPSSFLYGPVAAWTVDRDEKNLSSIGISDCSCNDRTRPGQLFDGPLHADLGHGHFDHA